MAKRKRRRKTNTPVPASTTATPSSQVNSGTNINIPDPTGGYLNYESNTASTEQADTESRLNRNHKKSEEDPYEKIRMADIWAEDEKSRKKQPAQTNSSDNPYLYRDEAFVDDQNRQGYESTSSVGNSNLSGIDYTREEEERAEETRRRNQEAQEAELNNGRSSMLPQGVTVEPGSFTGTDTDLQAVPLDADTANTPQFPYNWQKAEGDAPFVLRLTCRALQMVLKDSGSPAFGAALVTVDGGEPRLYDPREAGWTHCHPTVLFQQPEPAPHCIEIRMAPQDADKTFTILGFGWVR